MEETKSHESFPLCIPLLSITVAVLIYAIGASILAGLGIWVSILYVLYCIWVEIGVLRKSCVNCYYYGKVCAFGKGKLCALFFTKGDPQAFAEKQASWKDLLPDFMVLIFPLIGGIVLSVRDFEWLRVGMLAALIVLSFGGNAIIRGSFACKYCKQREIGCPAEKLFRKPEAQNE